MDALLTRIGNVFIAPQFAWLAALVPIIVVLYILKLRRTEVIIPSTFLWIKSLHDLTANAPFQRLRRNLLLLLQILVTLAIVAALMRPFMRAEAVQGRSVAILIDHSASMQTLEKGVSRLDLAKDRALDLVDNMAGGDRMMVIQFAERAGVLCELTEDRGLLRRAIEGIEPSDTRTNIRDVMLIASSLSPDNPDVPAVIDDLSLVLFSDGNLSDVDDVGSRAQNVTYVKIGESTDNAGIVRFSVRKPSETGASQQTFVLVRNEHTEPLNTTLTLYFEADTVAVEEVSIAPRSESEVLFEHPEFGQGVLRAELDHSDALSLDNTAWLALQPSLQVKVLLVANNESTAGYYIKRALALEPRAELSSVEPANYLRNDEYDLTIFDGFVPTNAEGQPELELLPAGASVFLDAVPPVPGLRQTGEVAFPPVLATNHDHPVTRFLNPSNLSIRSARTLVLPDGSRTLISTSGAPLIADVSRAGRQVLVVAFDIANSNWPLRLSFPLFMQNLVSWTPTSTLAADASVTTGGSIALQMPAGLDAASARVTAPDGVETELPLDPARAVFFAATERAGVYDVTIGETRQRYAVNLLDRNETAVSPADAIQFGRTEIAAERGMALQTRELWRWFLGAALGILLLEWWIYSRRAWV